MSVTADSFVDLMRFTCCSIVSSQYLTPRSATTLVGPRYSHSSVDIRRQLRKGAKTTVAGRHIARHIGQARTCAGTDPEISKIATSRFSATIIIIARCDSRESTFVQLRGKSCRFDDRSNCPCYVQT